MDPLSQLGYRRDAMNLNAAHRPQTAAMPSKKLAIEGTSRGSASASHFHSSGHEYEDDSSAALSATLDAIWAQVEARREGRGGWARQQQQQQQQQLPPAAAAAAAAAAAPT